MSHIAQIDLEIRDLEALKLACNRLGLEFREGQQKYRWWGQSQGDYPLPAGYAVEDLGKCIHAIGIPNDTQTHKCYSAIASANVPGAYEIGIVRRKDGKPGYSLLWDFYCGGYGLEDKVGANCSRLKQAYATEVAKKKALQQGFRVQERKLSNGSVQLVLSK